MYGLVVQNTMCTCNQLLTDDLRENADIQAKSTDFIRKANSILVRFGTCTPYILLFDSIILYFVLWLFNMVTRISFTFVSVTSSYE